MSTHRPKSESAHFLSDFAAAVPLTTNAVPFPLAVDHLFVRRTRFSAKLLQSQSVPWYRSPEFISVPVFLMFDSLHAFVVSLMSLCVCVHERDKQGKTSLGPACPKVLALGYLLPVPCPSTFVPTYSSVMPGSEDPNALESRVQSVPCSAVRPARLGDRCALKHTA